jgi:hypothetical protein
VKERKNFFGDIEMIDETIAKMVGNAPAITRIPLRGEEGEEIRTGTIEIHQRTIECVKLRAHEPRHYIVCWNSGLSYTDISFHRKMGEAHGALHAACRMFERYTRK